MRRVLLFTELLLLLMSCTSTSEPVKWRVFPLQRHVPHDGLAVVNQPDGYGLHIFLETDTTDPAVCKPRWLPDAARLFNGNGRNPFSSGLATRNEYFSAVGRQDVIRALKQELKALCFAREPKAYWQWNSPPTSEEQVAPLVLPPLEEKDILTDPFDEMIIQESLFRYEGQKG